MEISQYIGYILAVFVGVILGLIGSGGSILSVPILAYVMGIEPVLATAYSLFIVGTTALVGGFQKAKQQLVDFNKVFLFGIPTIISVFLTRRYVVPSIAEVVFSSGSFSLRKPVFIMAIFAIVMIFASVRMIKPLKKLPVEGSEKLNYFGIVLQGLFIGLVAGFVGAGGGFLIIPALIFMAKTPVKMAVGTSLFIVATQSLIGFLGDIRPNQLLDWQLIITFTTLSIIGIFIGNAFSKKVSSENLKIGFGWFVLTMGIFIIIKEFFLT